MSLRRSSSLRLRRPAAPTAVAVVLAVAACHAPAIRVPPPAPPATIRTAPTDSSHDWHVLLIAPFGSVLKDVPGTLHEVLLFRDEDHGAAADDAECYAPDSPAPRFVGRAPDEYLLCFKQDHLARIHAAVSLTDAEAPAVFAAACAAWLQHAAPASAATATVATATVAPATVATATAAERTGACEGREGDIRFSARLGEESTLSMVLESVSDP
jgi:hypothetical protein